jgi:hypothetical protein
MQSSQVELARQAVMRERKGVAGFNLNSSVEIGQQN